MSRFLLHTFDDVCLMFTAIKWELEKCDRWMLLHKESVRPIVERVLARPEHTWDQNHDDVMDSTWREIVPAVLDDRLRGVKVLRLIEVP